MKFNEALKGFSQWKLANKGTSAITKAELAEVRKAYREGKFNGKRAVRESGRSSFNDVVRKYSAFKARKTGNGVVTVREAKALKAGLASHSRMNESNSLVARYSAWKKATHGTGVVTMKERQMLARKANRMTERSRSTSRVESTIKKFSEWKKANGYSPVVTVREANEIRAHLSSKAAPMANSSLGILSKVREARRAVYKAKKLLREGDMMGAQDATMGAMDATAQADAGMDAMAADPNAAMQEPVPQTVVDAVSAIKASVDDLATQCGIEPAMDPGADAQAGMPGMTGVADPNAMGMDPSMGAQPVMESTAAIRRRLNNRARKISGIKARENIRPEFANPLGDIGGKNIPAESRTVNKSNDEYQLGNAPSAAQIAKGSAKDATKWPTKPMTGVPKSLVESMVDSRIKANEDNWDFAKILQSGVLG